MSKSIKEKAIDIKETIDKEMDTYLSHWDRDEIIEKIDGELRDLLRKIVLDKLRIKNSYSNGPISSVSSDSPIFNDINSAADKILNSLKIEPPVLSERDLSIIRNEYNRIYKATIKEEAGDIARKKHLKIFNQYSMS